MVRKSESVRQKENTTRHHANSMRVSFLVVKFVSFSKREI